MDLEKKKEMLVSIREKTKINQITVSRTIKRPQNGGDVFLSMTSNYSEPLDSEEARFASLMLARDVHILALKQSGAGGMFTKPQMDKLIENVKNNFNVLLVED